jgi:hypothetical protein
MRTAIEPLLYWTPRLGGLLFAAFLSVFALDAFDHGGDVRRTLIALAMHLIPAAVVLAALAVAWRWGWAGGIVFWALGAWYIVMAWGRFPLSVYFVIAGPLFLLGLLFEIGWWHARLRRRLGP